MVLFFSSGGSTLPVTACITGFAFDRTGLHLLRPKPVANVDVHIIRLRGLAPQYAAVHGGILLVKLIPDSMKILNLVGSLWHRYGLKSAMQANAPIKVNRCHNQPTIADCLYGENS